MKTTRRFCTYTTISVIKPEAIKPEAIKPEVTWRAYFNICYQLNHPEAFDNYVSGNKPIIEDLVNVLEIKNDFEKCFILPSLLCFVFIYFMYYIRKR